MAKKKNESGRTLNIGPKSTLWLNEAGIYTYEDLEAIGSVEAWRRVKAMRPREVSLNLLYGLEGALMGVRWDQLPPEVKAELRAAAEKD